MTMRAVLLLCLAMSPASAAAQSTPLYWDPSPISATDPTPDPRVAGYTISRGSTSVAFDQPLIEVGNVTMAMVPFSTYGTWRVAVQARLADGLLSAFSNIVEVNLPPPQTASPDCTSTILGGNAITDGDGALWTIRAINEIWRNETRVGAGDMVKVLAGVIYAHSPAGVNIPELWWRYAAGWVPVPSDPCAAPPPPTGPPPLNMPAPTVTMLVKTCQFTSSIATAPDGTGRWTARFRRDGSNMGSTDSTAPYGPVTATVGRGSYIFDILWTNTDGRSGTSATVTFECK